jgi:CubicO group peptidase (beta-lactamase class C family)
MKTITRRNFIERGGAGAFTLYAASGGALLAAPQSRRQNASTPKQLTELHEFIPRMMQHVGVPGLSIAVISEGRIAWRQAYGIRNTETRLPMTVDTPIEAASFSKAAFAYAVLKLCDRGKLGLDVPLWNYRPDFFLPADDPNSKLITARMVLSHTSGLRFRPDDKSVKIHTPPGKEWFYSPMGYGYLQRIVEHVTQEPLEPFMQHNLLRPFGLSHSSYDWNADYEKNAASGHDANGNRVPGQNFYERFRGFPAAEKAKILTVQPEDAAPGAAFSLTTTPTDYAKYLLEIIKPPSTDGVHLSPAMLNEMLKPQVKVSAPINWGLGWALESGEMGDVFYHYGNAGTLQHIAVGLRSRQSGVVVMTNSGNGLRMCGRVALRALGGMHMTYTLSFA